MQRWFEKTWGGSFVGRIDLQTEAYDKEENLPPQLFELAGSTR